MIFSNKLYLWARRTGMRGVHWLWQELPLSARSKKTIRHRLFRYCPFMFHRFKTYQDWLIQNPPINNSFLNSQHSGCSSPEAIGKTLRNDPSRRILVVSHDAQPFGGQFLALGMVKTLKQDLNLEVKVILLGGGRLKSDFATLATVHELNEFDSKISDVKKLAESLVQCGFTRAIVNTTVSGWIVPVLSHVGIECICLVHELPGAIRSLAIEKQAGQIASAAKMVVFPAQIVADGFAQFAHVEGTRQVIRPQGLYRKNTWRFKRETARAELRTRLKLSLNTKIVLAVGEANYRKGVDLFVACALEILAQRNDVDFVWVGPWDAKMKNDIEPKLLNSTHRDRIHFAGYESDTALYHAGSDVYALTSREDPFPNVVLESFDVGVPVVAFSATGGGASLVEDVGGTTVPPLNVAVFSAAVCRLLDSPDFAAGLGKTAQEYVDRHCSFRTYLLDLCGMLDVNLSKNE